MVMPRTAARAGVIRQDIADGVQKRFLFKLSTDSGFRQTESGESRNFLNLFLSLASANI